jgi:hypothetical protein
MKRYSTGLVVMSLALSVAACDDFLSGPGLTVDPNQAVQATPQQQLIALQANMSTRLEGQIARNATIYTQQIIGSNNQQLSYATQYGITEGDLGANFTGFWTGAGLVAMRNIQEWATTNNDQFLLGIAKVWEGLAFGTAAGVWGDLPYREAVGDFVTPRLDAQEQLYGDVQDRLDEGIAALTAAATTGSCEPADLIYCSTGVTRATEIARWIAAAHTLKARFHLHLVERNGNSEYTAALAEAQQGILEAPANANQAMDGQAPGDFRTFHGSTLDVDGNIWAEFLTARGGDIGAGATLVDLLKTRNDPRLSRYFTSNNASGNFWGLNQNNQLVGAPAGEVASVINIPIRRALTFRQPLVTWAENQLIIAEAQIQLGNEPAARTAVNNVRTAVGLAGLPGPVTLTDVMLEKYIVQFQNIDVWADYKRTCIPTLARYTGAAEIPGRLPYGSGERNANPNIPLPNQYPTGTTGSSALRNWNDPTACP